MKRFHVHVSVNDLARNIRFYSTLFGTNPAVVKPEYAKWMLEDPRVNFAISTRDPSLGVDHVGLQVDEPEKLASLEAQLKRADTELIPESNVTCCYAISDKYWVTDPQGAAWEVFHTIEDAPIYGEYRSIASFHAVEMPACCAPSAKTAGSKTNSLCC